MLGELAPAEIEQLLRTEWVARLGLHASRLTYVVPISYVYDGQAVIGHTGDGLKLEMLRANPKVCVEVDQVENLGNWRSVIAWGRFEELTGHAAADGLEQLMTRFAPMMTSPDTTPSHGAHPVAQHGTGPMHGCVFRIVLEEKSGRFEQQP